MAAADGLAKGESASDEPGSGRQHLIREAKAGNHRAFQTLVELHMKQTYNVAFSFVGDHDSAEDVAQEVFVRAHAKLASFREEAEFGTWLYRIAVNLSLNHLKQHRRHTEKRVDPMSSAAMNVAAQDNHPEGVDHRALIERALHELPTLQRAVVILRHIDGLSTRQVSRILRCTEGTVKTHLFRGLRKMRSKLFFLQEETV
jgi:RNA polymerase sigma-70 factor (ECF subfamily)